MCVNPFCEGLRRLMPDNFFDNAFIDIVNSLRLNRLNPRYHFRPIRHVSKSKLIPIVKNGQTVRNELLF